MDILLIVTFFTNTRESSVCSDPLCIGSALSVLFPQILTVLIAPLLAIFTLIMGVILLHQENKHKKAL